MVLYLYEKNPMKKTIITLFVFLTTLCNAQDSTFTYDVDSVKDFTHFEHIFTVENISKDIIYNSIISWVALNYKSSNAVTDLKDKESGEIVLKGICNIPTGKVLGSVYNRNVYHTLHVSIKDNKYKVVLDYGNIIYEATSGVSIGTSYVSGSPRKEYSVADILETGRKKDNAILKPALVNEFVSICNSLLTSIKEGKKDDW